jgi:hypothetical protein
MANTCQKKARCGAMRLVASIRFLSPQQGRKLERRSIQRRSVLENHGKHKIQSYHIRHSRLPEMQKPLPTQRRMPAVPIVPPPDLCCNTRSAVGYRLQMQPTPRSGSGCPDQNENGRTPGVRPLILEVVRALRRSPCLPRPAPWPGALPC